MLDFSEVLFSLRVFKRDSEVRILLYVPPGGNPSAQWSLSDPGSDAGGVGLVTGGSPSLSSTKPEA